MKIVPFEEKILREIEHLKTEIFNVVNELKSIKRSQGSIQKSLDLIYDDRKILEDMQAADRRTQELLIYNRDHVERVMQDTKAEVVESKIEVGDKIDEVKEVIGQNGKDGIIKKIRKRILGRR